MEREFLETSCEHPAIMRVFDTGVFTDENGEFPFVITEYLPATLATKTREGSVTTVEKLSYTLQLLSALVYLDNLQPPVVHRDIKPQNIFLKGPSCVLGDFGLMKILDGEHEADREIFKESVLPGMPYYYRTPDLIAYANQETGISTKSDVFQLGLVLAELFTGRNPALAPSDGDFLTPLELEEMQWIPGRLGGRIKSLIRRMLVYDPSAREDAAHLMDPWRGAFQEAIGLSHDLEGRAF
jgi:serine/threonine protein kinase